MEMEDYIKELVRKEIEIVREEEVFLGPKGDIGDKGIDDLNGEDGKDSIDMDELAEVITGAVKQGVTQALEEMQEDMFEKMKSGRGMMGFGNF